MPLAGRPVWADPTTEVQLHVLSKQTGQVRTEAWTLLQVLERMVTTDPGVALVCPNMPRLPVPRLPVSRPWIPSRSMPRLVMKTNKERSNDRELVRLLRADPYFVCRITMAQKSGRLNNQYSKLHVDVRVALGEVDFVDASKVLSEDEMKEIEGGSPLPSIRDRTPVKMELSDGCTMILPAGSIYTMSFLECSSFLTGNIVPRATTTA